MFAAVLVTVEAVPPNTDPVVDLFALKENRDVPEEAWVVEVELLPTTPNWKLSVPVNTGVAFLALLGPSGSAGKYGDSMINYLSPKVL